MPFPYTFPFLFDIPPPQWPPPRRGVRRDQLFVYLFWRYSTDPRFLADLTPYVSDIVFSVAQHGGLRDIELEFSRRPVDAFSFAYEHIGKRIVIMDNHLDIVAEGTIMAPSITEGGNRVLCAGPYWDLCFRQVYNDPASWVDTGTTTEQIEDMLDNECPAVSPSREWTRETSTPNHPWQPAENAYPGELIPRLAAMSDDQHREWYFWLQSAPPIGGTPQLPIPHFDYMDWDLVDFWVDREDCAPGGLEISPSLISLVTDVRIMYRDAAGAQQQTGSASDADKASEYWKREVWNIPIATVPTAVAEQYRDMYLARFKEPQQSMSFRLNSWVWDRMGNRWPLWKVIQRFPCNLGIRNLVPEAVALAGVDWKQVFNVAAARYSYARNVLEVTPDLEENTLEALIAMWSGAG